MSIFIKTYANKAHTFIILFHMYIY